MSLNFIKFVIHYKNAHCSQSKVSYNRNNLWFLLFLYIISVPLGVQTTCTPATALTPKEVKEMIMEEYDGMEGLIGCLAYARLALVEAAAAVFTSQLTSPSISKLLRRPSLIIPAVPFKWCT